MPRSPKSLIPTAAVLLVLCGCTMPQTEHSPAYEAGYADGCATGAGEGSGVPREPKRNAELANDSDYRAGWTSGHAQCAAPRQNGL